MGHQELHLVVQDAAVAQDKVFPQGGHIRRVEQGHFGLLRGATALAVVASAAGGDHIHPVVHPVLGKRDDVLSGEFGFVKMVATISADVAVAGKQFGIGQARAQIKGIDGWHASGADDAVDRNDGLLARDGIVATPKNGDFAP